MVHNKVVMVTGAAQGIGRATAEKFLAQGWQVLAIDQQAEGLATLQSAAPTQVTTLVLDVTGQDAPAQAMALAKQRFGRLDALINNAGIGKSKAVHETTDAELDRFYAINLRSVFRFSREALGLMASGACMVHVASTFGLIGNPVASSYAATKAALIGLTRQMAVDYGPKGIRINAVAPVALEDTCPHRFYPLSKGQLIGDAVECGYHGLQFDCSGRCQLVPGQDKIPDSAKVRSFPVVQRWGWIWIWMGDPALADEGLIIDIPQLRGVCG